MKKFLKHAIRALYLMCGLLLMIYSWVLSYEAYVLGDITYLGQLEVAALIIGFALTLFMLIGVGLWAWDVMEVKQ